MFKQVDKKGNRQARHKRARKHITGTAERPRLNVFRSTNHIYVQVIDDLNRVTLVSASSLDADIKSQGNGANKEAAQRVGALIAKKALEKGIENVVFDRGGYIYHGRIQALADSAREGGLKF